MIVKTGWPALALLLLAMAWKGWLAAAEAHEGDDGHGGHHEPAYGYEQSYEPTYETPVYEPPYETPTYEAPGYETPSPEVPSYESPSPPASQYRPPYPPGRRRNAPFSFAYDFEYGFGPGTGTGIWTGTGPGTEPGTEPGTGTGTAAPTSDSITVISTPTETSSESTGTSAEPTETWKPTPVDPSSSDPAPSATPTFLPSVPRFCTVNEKDEDPVKRVRGSCSYPEICWTGSWNYFEGYGVCIGAPCDPGEGNIDPVEPAPSVPPPADDGPQTKGFLWGSECPIAQMCVAAPADRKWPLGRCVPSFQWCDGLLGDCDHWNDSDDPDWTDGDPDWTDGDPNDSSEEDEREGKKRLSWVCVRDPMSQCRFGDFGCDGVCYLNEGF